MEKDKIDINGNIKGIGIVTGGEVTQIFNNEHKTPPQLTSKLGKSTIIGRKKELQEIDQQLNSSNTLLLINGIGGVGKSNIASYYLHSHKEQFDYYGFFEGLESFTTELKPRLNLKSEKPNELFLEALAKLSTLEGDKLLVLDDVKESEENRGRIDGILALKGSGYKILFTSRNIIKNIKNYSLDTLTLSDAKELFFKYYKTNEIDKVEKVLNYLDCHALFVELVAKTISSNSYNLDNIIKKIKNNELSKIEFLDENSGKVKQFNKNLEQLFSLQKLDEEYILLLKKLATLPPIEIKLTLLEDILKKEHLKARLEFLVNRGWLISNENSYKLHQVIKEYILHTHPPLFAEIEEVFLYFYEILKEIDIQTAKKHIDKLDYFNSIFHILLLIKDRRVKGLSLLTDILKFQRLKRIVFNSNFSPNVDNLGMNEALSKAKKIIPTVKYFSCTLGSFYRDLGYYNKALHIYLKALNISKIIYKNNSSQMATCYANLAGLYQRMGEYKKAEPLYRKAVKIFEEVLGTNHTDTATIYNNLARFYHSMGEYKKAESLSLKALVIREKLLEKEHSHTVVSYNDLAGLYQSMGEYKKAELLYLKALKIREKVLGEEHPDTATIYNNLGDFYYERRESKKAYGFKKRAVEVWLKVLPSNHPVLIRSKKGLEMIEGRL